MELEAEGGAGVEEGGRSAGGVDLPRLGELEDSLRMGDPRLQVLE